MNTPKKTPPQVPDHGTASDHAASMRFSATPTLDRHMVMRVQVDETTESGLYLPEKYRDSAKPVVATVIASGPGRIDEGRSNRSEDGRIYHWPMSAKPGDRVLISKYAGSEIKIAEGDQKLSVAFIRDSEILAVISDGADRVEVQ